MLNVELSLMQSIILAMEFFIPGTSYLHPV